MNQHLSKLICCDPIEDVFSKFVDGKTKVGRIIIVLGGEQYLERILPKRKGD